MIEYCRLKIDLYRLHIRQAFEGRYHSALLKTEFIFATLFPWLKKTNYSGWHSMDQYPYREDGYGAIKSSVLYLQKLESILESVGMNEVEELIKKRDPIATSEFIRSNLIK